MSDIKEMRIVGVEANTLKIEKQGGSWGYKLKNEVEPGLLELLEQRKIQGWETLGIAQFKPINPKTGKGLHLEAVLL